MLELHSEKGSSWCLMKSNYVVFICVHVSWKLIFFLGEEMKKHKNEKYQITQKKKSRLENEKALFDINKHYLKVIYENTLFRYGNH